MTPGRVDIDDLDVDMDQGQRLLYGDELFTGEVEERLGGAVVSLDSYVAGVQHGPSREWCEDGTLQSEGTAREGRPEIRDDSTPSPHSRALHVDSAEFTARAATRSRHGT